MSTIFYHNEEQKRLAERTRDREAARIGRRIFTEIVPFTGFYLAEDYHQKYYLQQYPGFIAELGIVYPDFSDLVNSTASARVNGYIGGYGKLETLLVEIDSLNLPPDEKAKLQQIVGGPELLHPVNLI